uniref:Vomeronasal type-1 receptor n=1 Tax=Equus asinus TaxID=9793 RepID=A0A8C4MW36_EQUAS
FFLFPLLKWAIAIIFWSQTMVGILGNFSLLYHYLFLSHTECKWRATDLILKHLTMANSLIILSEGVSQTMAAFGLKHFFTDFGCSLLLYVSRVGRGIIMISPMNSYWKVLKVRAPEYVGYSISLCWILYLFVNLIFPMYASYVSSQWSMRNITRTRDFEFCFANDHKIVTGSLYVTLIVFPEVSFSVIIIWTSGSIIFTLYRHKQSSPEFRATLSIIVLVSTFLSFQSISSIFQLCISLIYNPTSWLVDTASLISVCFPSVSPFLLMSHFLLHRKMKDANQGITMLKVTKILETQKET